MRGRLQPSRLQRVKSIDWQRLAYQLLAVVLALLLVVAGLWLLSRITRILIIVVLAVILAYALEPVLSRLESRGLPRWLAALGVYVVVLLVVGLAGFLLIRPLTSQASQLAGQLPGYFDRGNAAFTNLANAYGIQLTAAATKSNLLASVQGALGQFLSEAVQVVTTVVGAVVDIVLVLFLGFWFMVDGRRFRNAFAALFPAGHQSKVQFVEDTVGQVLGGYIRAQLTMAVVIGVSAGLGCFVLGVPYPAVIGLFAFFFELIPMVGPILGSVPAIIIAAFQPFPRVLYVALFFAVMQVAENNLLAPRIAGHAVGLHPAVAVLALLVGAEIGGIWGALFALPAVAVVSVLASAIWKSAHGEAVVVKRGTMTFKLKLPRLRRAPKGTA
jgi:predicted PurR-regulated permease PerM